MKNYKFIIYSSFFILTQLASSFLFAQQLVDDEEAVFYQEILKAAPPMPQPLSKTPEIKNPPPSVHSSAPRIITESELGEIIPDPVRNTIDIKGQDHYLTVKERDILLRNINRTWLAGVLSDSVPYRPYVRQKLKENKMPMVLQYLPVVESNYKITAISRSGAVGMWQFMANSMYPFLTKNNWYDQRKDPWLATDAAIKKLKDNYRQFGDWALAIGAYNCGAGAMQRAITKAGKKDYWYLASKGYLSSQTTHYVPKLLAIADIVENAEYYGAIEIGAADKLIEYTAPEEFDYVKITGMLSYSQIAEITKIPSETIKFLNPCLLKGCTPPQQTYTLRFPKGTGESSQKLLENAFIPKDVLMIKVKKGDTLWGISKQYGVTVKELCQANGIKENSVLSINQSLIIPIFK